jgi:hypothetical protein
MSGWHMRLWRRVRLAPGVTINLSKSGPSLSLGPRGSKVTFGQRGVRQTVGIPGTGLFASRQLSSTTKAQPLEPPSVTPVIQPAVSPATPSAVDAPRFEVHYGWPLIVAVAVGATIAGAGYGAATAWASALLALSAGLVYEIFAAHHPRAAKVILQVAIAVVAVATVVAGIVIVVGLAVVGASTRRKRR